LKNGALLDAFEEIFATKGQADTPLVWLKRQYAANTTQALDRL
jgi:hypothetical protein